MNTNKLSPLCAAVLIPVSEQGITSHMRIHTVTSIMCNAPKKVENQGTTAHQSNFVPIPLYPPFQVGNPNKKKGAVLFLSEQIYLTRLVKSSWLSTEMC